MLSSLFVIPDDIIKNYRKDLAWCRSPLIATPNRYMLTKRLLQHMVPWPTSYAPRPLFLFRQMNQFMIYHFSWSNRFMGTLRLWRLKSQAFDTLARYTCTGYRFLITNCDFPKSRVNLLSRYCVDRRERASLTEYDVFFCFVFFRTFFKFILLIDGIAQDYVFVTLK